MIFSFISLNHNINLTEREFSMSIYTFLLKNKKVKVMAEDAHVAWNFIKSRTNYKSLSFAEQVEVKLMEDKRVLK